MKNIKQTLVKSIKYSLSFIGIGSAVIGIWGYTIKDINDKWSWWQCGFILIGLIIVVTLVILGFFCIYKRKSYSITINGQDVLIKQGDIFCEKGWRVIPCTECFDTDVDNVIISEESLNGQMLKDGKTEIDKVKKVIAEAAFDNHTDLTPIQEEGKMRYPLGRIVPYSSGPFDDYLMLSFAHQDYNYNAYIDIGEYEQLLFRMWAEIRRTYAGKPVAIPLLGTGVTTIKGKTEKNYTEMLKCILCTFKQSAFQAKNRISIVLAEEAMNKIDMSAIKDCFK